MTIFTKKALRVSILTIGLAGLSLVAHAQNIGSFPGESDKGIPAFIASFYNFGLMIGGVLAVGMITVGAIYYSISGAVDKQAEAKSMITSALLGLALLFGSYLILNTVNPKLTTLTVDTSLPHTGQCLDAAKKLLGKDVLRNMAATEYMDASGVCQTKPSDTRPTAACDMVLNASSTVKNGPCGTLKIVGNNPNDACYCPRLVVGKLDPGLLNYILNAGFYVTLGINIGGVSSKPGQYAQYPYYNNQPNMVKYVMCVPYAFRSDLTHVWESITINGDMKPC